MTVEYVEVRGKTVDVAVQAALEELEAKSVEEVVVEILQEPERGFLGIGGRDAVVKVSRKPQERKKRSRKRKRKKSAGSAEDTATAGSKSGGGGKSGRGGRQESGSRNRKDSASKADGGKKPSGDRKASDRKASQKSGNGGGRRQTDGARSKQDSPKRAREEVNVPIEEQMPVVEGFLTGLVDSFGLDGEVEVGLDGDVIVADIKGEQTEAMVGNRGSVIEAIHELTKTVMHRKLQTAARLRLDIAGYGERRRRALKIYAEQLVDQVVAEGGEIMLEPMSASDRKVIHDAVAEYDGVRSYSEGEAPQRYVVLQRVAAEDASPSDPADAASDGGSEPGDGAPSAEDSGAGAADGSGADPDDAPVPTEDDDGGVSEEE